MRTTHDPRHGMPSVTNRHGDGETSGATTFGPPGQGGGDDRPERDSGTRGGRDAKAGGKRGRGPKGYTRSDTLIADDVQLSLREDGEVDAGEILVMVEGGVVTLTGNVPERAMKRAAEDCVSRVAGVGDVVNRLRVDDGSASFGRPGEAVRSGQDQQGSGFSSSMRGQEAWRVR